jgi:hypothetical protein
MLSTPVSYISDKCFGTTKQEELRLTIAPALFAMLRELQAAVVTAKANSACHTISEMSDDGMRRLC